MSSSSDHKQQLVKKVRSHEIAIDELNHLSASRGVYQKSGNIFFRKDVKVVIASEQKQLDSAKTQLQKLDAA